MYLRKSHT